MITDNFKRLNIILYNLCLGQSDWKQTFFKTLKSTEKEANKLPKSVVAEHAVLKGIIISDVLRFVMIYLNDK